MLIATLVLAQAAAAQVAIGVQAPARVATCEAFAIVVRVSAPGHVAPVVATPSLAPFALVRRNVRPAVSFSPRGDASTSVEHRYVVTADRPGTFTLPPFTAELGGTVLRSRRLTIAVGDTPGPGAPRILADARIDPRAEVNFHAMAVPDTVFVGQQVQYEVAVFLDERVRERLRRTPTFFPPDMPGMLAYDLPATQGELPRRRVAGRCLDALVYQRAVFPLQPGRTVIPPAQLVYALPVGPGIFSREESHELRTGPVTVVAVEPPAAGRPAGDIGAVGDLTVGSRLDATRGRVGDPLTLTVRVAGEGNVKLLPRPRVSVPWASLVPDGERVEVDSASRRVRGTKEFDWLVTPRVGGTVVVPPVEYPHFNPQSRTYVVARTQPLSLEVEPAPLARVDTAVTVRRLALRATYRGPLGAPLHAHPLAWLLAFAAPVPALVGAARRRARRAERAVTAAGALQRLGVAAVDARDVRRAFVGALAERLRLPAGVFTRAGALERSLRRSGVTRELAAEAERFLRGLDAAAYDGTTAPGYDLAAAARDAGRIFAAVDAEALAPWELGPEATLAIAMVLALTVTAGAVAEPGTAAAAFAAASARYEAGDFIEAARGFERIALGEPRAPDAWANFGTASWAASDTAGAVAGWQRALRLEPDAADMRARLDAVRLEPSGAPGHVPGVGVTPLAMSALVLWLAACAIAAWRPARGSALRAGAIAAAAAAVLAAGGAVMVDERLEADDTVVLRRGGALALSPAIGARGHARVETGEVGVAGGREGGWTHVRFEGERAGWVPSVDLVSIARAPLRAD